jgi:hypothetical protein
LQAVDLQGRELLLQGRLASRDAIVDRAERWDDRANDSDVRRDKAPLLDFRDKGSAFGGADVRVARPITAAGFWVTMFSAAETIAAWSGYLPLTPAYFMPVRSAAALTLEFFSRLIALSSLCI